MHFQSKHTDIKFSLSWHFYKNSLLLWLISFSMKTAAVLWICKCNHPHLCFPLMPQDRSLAGCPWEGYLTTHPPESLRPINYLITDFSYFVSISVEMLMILSSQKNYHGKNLPCSINYSCLLIVLLLARGQLICFTFIYRCLTRGNCMCECCLLAYSAIQASQVLSGLPSL